MSRYFESNIMFNFRNIDVARIVSGFCENNLETILVKML